MPTVLRVGQYRYFFYSGDRDEPPHIHVQRENCVAKFWLDPVRLQSSGGLRPSEILIVQRTVEDELSHLMEAWIEFFQD